MHPIVEVTVDGQPVAGTFYERLVSLSVVDKEGVSSDTFTAELNDGPPDFLALPRTGALVDIRLGYRPGGVSSLGVFTADKVQAKCLPYGLSISGKAADLRSGKLKENQERHWDKTPLSDIVSEIAGEAGLQPAISGAVGAHQYEWLAQQDESDIHFLERLARRHNALFTIKHGRLIFAERGSGFGAGGGFVGTVFVTPDRIIPGTCAFEANDRTKYSKVVAYYQDRDKAERVEVEADADAEGDSIFRITEPFADVAEADKAAQSKAKDLQRGKGAASVTIVGDTAVIAGAPLIFEGVRPGLDGVPYIIETVSHEYSKGAGYRTKIDAKLYDGKSAGSSGTGGSAGGEADAGAVAPGAPAGTPATPRQFSSPRSMGLNT